MSHGLLKQSGSERKAQDRKVSDLKNFGFEDFQDSRFLKILISKFQDFQPLKNAQSSNLFFSLIPLELAISVPDLEILDFEDFHDLKISKFLDFKISVSQKFPVFSPQC